MEYRYILFEVFAGPKAEKKYRIYANGEVEGFGDDARVVNCYPLLIQSEIRRYCEANGIPFKSPGTTKRSKPSRSGAKHSTRRKSAGSTGAKKAAAAGVK